MTFHRDGQPVVLNEVPADVCENCCEPYVAEDVAVQTLSIAAEARHSQAPILVRDFAPAA